MKPDEIPSTTTEYWEKKMKRKKSQPQPEADAQDQMDPQMMEQMAAMRGNPNLRPMGRKRGMRRQDGGPVEAGKKYLVGEKGKEEYISNEKSFNLDDYRAPKRIEPIQNNVPEMNHMMKQEWVTKTETTPKISVIRGMKKTKELPDERRKGGPVKKAKPYLVGEEGPEMFTPEQDGRIIPNHDLRPMGRGRREKKMRKAG